MAGGSERQSIEVVVEDVRSSHENPRNRERRSKDSKDSKDLEAPFSDYGRASVEMSRRVQGSKDVRKRIEMHASVVDEEEKRSLEMQMDRVKEDDLENFPISKGLTSSEAESILQEVGPNVLPEQKTPKWKIFVSQLYQPMPLMLWVAGIVELAIGNYIDGGILIGIIFLNATISYHEATKAADAVDALKSSLKPTAICFRDGEWNREFDASQLVPGDLVELALGAAIPADCMVNHGSVEVDESAMTGESFPVTLHERELAKMGATVVRGEVTATVVFTGSRTFFGKTAAMLAPKNEMSNITRLLLRIMVVLVSASIVLTTTCFIYLMVENEGVKESLSFAVVVMVASIPLALEVVATTTLALGSRQMSEEGAIVSRLAAIEDMAGMNMLCSDKTGTLTKNKMFIQEDAPAFMDGMDQMKLLEFAALAAKYESPPKDALDTLVLRCPLWLPDFQQQKEEMRANMAYEEMEAKLDKMVGEAMLKRLVGWEQLHFTPFDPRVKRTSSVVRKPDGTIIRITKGAPHIVAELDSDHKIVENCNGAVMHFGQSGVRCLAIAISEPLADYKEGDEEDEVAIANTKWHLAGLLTFADPPRDDTKATVAQLEKYGVPVRMVTGDHVLIARKTAKDLDMGDRSGPNWPNIQGPQGLPLLLPDGSTPNDLVENYGKAIESADGFAQVFPEHKFLIVETFRQLGYKCGMTGDGVNDAPALNQADVGIAVAGATDAAKAAADIILTNEGLSTICHGVIVARKVFQRVYNFLNYRIAATLQLLVFFFIALFTFQPIEYLPPYPYDRLIVPDWEEWPRFFKMPVLYLMIITLLNDGTLISIGYDNVIPSRHPEVWNLKVLFSTSIVLGTIACSSSLIWLWALLDSWNSSGVFEGMGIGGVTYGQIICSMYLKISVSDFLTLISCRTQDRMFFSSMPHPVLLVGAVVAITASIMISVFWPCGKLDGVPVCGMSYRPPKLLVIWTLIYCIIVFFIQDTVKFLYYKLMRRTNLFGINDHDVAHEAKHGPADDAKKHDVENPED